MKDYAEPAVETYGSVEKLSETVDGGYGGNGGGNGRGRGGNGRGRGNN